MSKSRVTPSADPSREAVGQYLAATAQRELDALRAELDVRLAALETALAHPDPRTSLERLVIDLARVATAEAESAARRASLEGQRHEQERAAVAASEAYRTLDAQRTIADELRAELDTERAIVQALRVEVQQAGASFEAERKSVERLRKELDEARTLLEQERQAAASALRQAEQAEQALQNELAAVRRSAEGRVADDEGHRATVESLERRCAELDEDGRAAAALASEAVRERDALAATVETEREQAGAAFAEVEGYWKEAEDRVSAATARASDSIRERDALAATVETEREQAAAALSAVEDRLKEAEARVGTATARASEAERDRDAQAAALESERERAAAAFGTVEARLAAIEAERTEGERSLKEAEVRADEASGQRDELAALLESAKTSIRDMNAAVEERLAAIDANRTRMQQAWEEAKARAAAAIRERDVLAAQLEAVRNTGHQDPGRARRLEAATERVRVLELQLFEREKGPKDRDVELGSLLAAAPAPVSNQAGKRATRHAFKATRIQVDREPAVLIDLSVTGAQVVFGKPPEVGRIVTVTLPSDDAPCFCQGRLLWSRREQSAKGRPFRYPAGIVFTAADEAAIEAFISRHAKA